MKTYSFLPTLGLLFLPLLLADRQSALSTPQLATKTIDCGSAKGIERVVCLADAFRNMLSADQQAALQRPYSKADAARWSNLPAAMSSRVGIQLGTLSPAQLAASRTLMAAVLANNAPNEGADELEGNLVADDDLASMGGGSEYGRGDYYMAFLGAPSTSGLWELQFGGHHYTFANTYDKGKLIGATPSFRAVEPMNAITVNNRTYQPMEQERQAFADVVSGLSSSEQNAAKLTVYFRDVLLGPRRDNQFPATKQGLKVGELSSASQKRVLEAIKLYVNDLEPTMAAVILKKYAAELPDTYVAYSGSPTMGQQGDYIRLDGPSVWIEYSMQHGIIVRNAPHPHSVWRDRSSDYGGN